MLSAKCWPFYLGLIVFQIWIAIADNISGVDIGLQLFVFMILRSGTNMEELYT